MATVLDGNAPPAAKPPRLPRVRPAGGSLIRIGAYLMMGFGAVISSPPPVPARALPWISLARAVCRDPDPGGVAPALERIDDLLAAAEALITTPSQDQLLAIGHVHAAATIAATEPLPA